MLRIIVDGEEYGPYNDLPGTSITVVRLYWAAPTSLTIHFLHSWGHFVVVNDEEGMTHSGAHRVRDDGWRIFVSMDEPMTIRGHVITFAPDIGDLEERLGICNMHA
jgi:hypothetical protein